MSILQEQAVRMISDLSDDNVRQMFVDDEGMQAFHRLEAVRAEVIKYLPEDFDPDKELEEARAERYVSWKYGKVKNKVNQIVICLWQHILFIIVDE